jgi:hypothetical protein
MDLTPGERAILDQIRDLYAGTSKREQPLATITGQWQPITYEAYKSVLTGLVSKGFLEPTSEGRAVIITNAGFAAMGLTLPKPPSSVQTGGQAVARSSTASARKMPGAKAETAKRTHAQPGSKPRINALEVLSFVVSMTVAAWLLWRVFTS